MSRINTNVTSLTAQRVLFNNNNGLNSSLERLSTGLRINRGKDDPAGLIASENLRAEISSTSAAINNAERADRVVNIAEGGLGEVSNLLTELQGLITTTANSAGLSDAEKEANQLQIDSILQTIDRVAGQTSFQGTKLLNGNFDFRVSSQVAGIDDLRVNGAKFEGDNLDVNVLVTQSAQRAGLFLSLGGTALDLGGATGDTATNGATSTFVIEIGGSIGSREFSFASGTTVTQIQNTINTFSDITGVSAVVSGDGVRLQSNEFGGDEFVNVKVVDDAQQGGNVTTLTADDFGTGDADAGAFSSTAASNGIRDDGQDLGATINGIVATTNGKTARVDSDFLNLEVTLKDTESQTRGSVNSTDRTFSIVGGGATFQLGGNVDIGSKVTLGISEVAIRNLGSNAAGGFLDDIGSGKDFNVVDGDLTTAQKIVSEAIEQVSTTRGRLGAFQRNTLGATMRSLSVSFENSSAAESVIRDTDFASETAALTRSQILSQAATNTLALANNQPQNALQLLG